MLKHWLRFRLSKALPAIYSEKGHIWTCRTCMWTCSRGLRASQAGTKAGQLKLGFCVCAKRAGGGWVVITASFTWMGERARERENEAQLSLSEAIWVDRGRTERWYTPVRKAQYISLSTTAGLLWILWWIRWLLRCDTFQKVTVVLLVHFINKGKTVTLDTHWRGKNFNQMFRYLF